MVRESDEHVDTTFDDKDMRDKNCDITIATGKPDLQLPHMDQYNVCEACNKSLIGIKYLYFDIFDAGYTMGSSLSICPDCVRAALNKL